MSEEKKNTVLIVDDENINLKILSHILENEYTVYTSEDGISAVEKAKELLPDLILLDIIMPGTDGYATLVRLKSLEETKEIPVIFISGLSHSDEEEKGLSLGAVDYITKPFSATIIQLRVRHQIQIINQTRKIKQLSPAAAPETQ
jgi:PleD family two-component response regulator